MFLLIFNIIKHLHFFFKSVNYHNEFCTKKIRIKLEQKQVIGLYRSQLHRRLYTRNYN